MDGHGQVYFWTQTLELHITFMCLKCSSLTIKKNVKIIRSSRAAQKEAVGRIWPIGQRLPAPALGDGLQGFFELHKIQYSLLCVWTYLDFSGESLLYQMLTVKYHRFKSFLSIKV